MLRSGSTDWSVNSKPDAGVQSRVYPATRAVNRGRRYGPPPHAPSDRDHSPASLLAGCGGKSASKSTQPNLGAKGTDTQAAQGLGFPAVATKNTTRVGGADPVANAAAVSQAVFPATAPHPATP